MSDIVFGPVPSRRLGRSLGINHIPPKICSYACAYCQLGRTLKMQIERQPFYDTDTIYECVGERLRLAASEGDPIDYLTLVPDGEPTLDAALGEIILALKNFGIPVAVITNASLLWRDDVRSELLQADWVSVKVDSVDENTWRKINRPHGGLSHAAILEGVCAFARVYQGQLVTETLLVRDLNDDRLELSELSHFLQDLHPMATFLSVPSRPPAEAWVRRPAKLAVDWAYLVLSAAGLPVRMLTGYEGSDFSSTGSAEADILSITAVHPLRADAVQELLTACGEDWDLVKRLIDTRQLVEQEYDGYRFYLQRFTDHRLM